MGWESDLKKKLRDYEKSTGHAAPGAPSKSYYSGGSSSSSSSSSSKKSSSSSSKKSSSSSSWESDLKQKLRDYEKSTGHAAPGSPDSSYYSGGGSGGKSTVIDTAKGGKVIINPDGSQTYVSPDGSATGNIKGTFEVPNFDDYYQRMKEYVDDKYGQGQGYYQDLKDYINDKYSQSEDYYQRMKKYVDNMYNSQEDARLARLREIVEQQKQGYKNQKSDVKGEYNKALGELEQYKGQAAPGFQNLRNQTASTNAQNVQRLREVMAQKGLLAGGENLTSTAQLGAAYQQAMGDIGTQESQYNADMDRRMSDLSSEKANQLSKIDEAIQLLKENAGEKELAAVSQLDSERSRALLDLMQRADDRAFTIDERNYQRYQDEANRLLQEKSYESDLNTQKIRDALDRFKVYGVADSYISDVLGIPTGTKTYQYLDSELDRAYKSKTQKKKKTEDPYEIDKADKSKYTTIERSLEALPPLEAYQRLLNYKSDIVKDIGPELYKRLFDRYVAMVWKGGH